MKSNSKDKRTHLELKQNVAGAGYAMSVNQNPKTVRVYNEAVRKLRQFEASQSLDLLR